VCGSGVLVSSSSLLIRGTILPAVRQKLHLSPCADFRSQLCEQKTSLHFLCVFQPSDGIVERYNTSQSQLVLHRRINRLGVVILSRGFPVIPKVWSWGEFSFPRYPETSFLRAIKKTFTIGNWVVPQSKMTPICELDSGTEHELCSLYVLGR
jgi:hypothetical protein